MCPINKLAALHLDLWSGLERS